MSKWIDADALIESIKDTADLGGWIGEALYQIKQVTIKYIDSAPSIDIVRCKECRCGKHEFIDNMEWIYCKHHFDYWIPDDFCSYGEREGE